MARLDHRNLVKVGDCRETDGKLWLRMELAPGLEMSDGRRIVSLADLLDAYDGRPMKPDFVRGELDGILAGLGAAHAADLIHRDLKPSNILLWPDGRPKISDFGLVRVVNQEWRASKIRFVAESVPGMGMAPAGSATRALLGSYEFMSPEQKRGLEADARSDLYAVGLMAFRMLTGHDTPGMEVASSLVPGLDPKWDAWLVWLLKPDPRMRCPGVMESLAALPGTGTVKPPPPEKPENRKRRSLAGAWVIGVAAVLGLVAWAALNKDKPSRERRVEPAVDEAAIRKEQADEKARADARVAADLAAAKDRGTDNKSQPNPPKALPQSPVAAGPWDATKELPFVNSLGMKFVPVPVTKGPSKDKKMLFCIWETRVKDYEAYARTNPGANDSWRELSFVQGDDHPVVDVSWEEQIAFCKWLTEKERKEGRIGSRDEYRLPTDMEWSFAVGIGEEEYGQGGRPGVFGKTEKEDRSYPWGTMWPPPQNAGNYFGEEAKGVLWVGNNDDWPISGYRDGYVHTSPVGTFAKNNLGIHDLGGNVWEYCMDEIKESPDSHILRGGSWARGRPKELLSSYRDCDWDRYGGEVGFRCVLELKADNTQQGVFSGELPKVTARRTETPPEHLNQTRETVSGKTYVVQPGDTLWRIANRCKVSAQSIMSANGISDARKIKTGMTLVIPKQ